MVMRHGGTGATTPALAHAPRPSSAFGLSVVSLLFAGAAVWVLSTLLALASCSGSFGGDERVGGAPRVGPGGVPLGAPPATRNLGAAKAAPRVEDSSVDPLSSLSDNVHALLVLRDAGVLQPSQDDATSLALALAEALAAPPPGAKVAAPAVDSEAAADQAAADAAALELEQKRLRRRRRTTVPTIVAADGTVHAEHAPQDPMYSHQTCYIGLDEAEVCTYEGVFCYDGESPVIVTDFPMKDPERINDFTHSCMDPRYYEPASLEDGGCSFFKAGERKSYDTMKPPKPATDYPMSLKLRRWGPLNRNGLLFFREMGKQELWGNQPEHVFGPIENISEDFFPYLEAASRTRVMDENDTLVEEPEPFNMPGLPTLQVERRTKVGNLTIDWIKGSLWLAGIDGQWFSNPFHWWSKIGAIYDVQRQNFSSVHPSDGYVQPLAADDIGRVPSIAAAPATKNRAQWKVGSQLPYPPMDVVAFTGDGATVLDSVSSLNDWFASVLDLAIPKTSKYYFNDLISKLGRNHMLCARSGAIPGGKNKLFTGRLDASMWRQYAYMKAGLSQRGILPHPAYPPRKITVIDRKGMNGRGIYNRDELVKAVADLGVPYELVNSMAKMSFTDQVALMAGTGILIAPHGAALANTMFLPAHAVVIEMFPFLMKKLTYRYLASLFDLHYHPVYSWDLLPTNMTQYYGVELMNEMYFWENCVATNVSSYDALNIHACNAASKNYPIVVNIPDVKRVLNNAVDTIGAFSLKNPAWKEIADKMPAPETPEWVKAAREGK